MCVIFALWLKLHFPFVFGLIASFFHTVFFLFLAFSTLRGGKWSSKKYAYHWIIFTQNSQMLSYQFFFQLHLGVLVTLICKGNKVWGSIKISLPLPSHEVLKLPFVIPDPVCIDLAMIKPSAFYQEKFSCKYFLKQVKLRKKAKRSLTQMVKLLTEN